MGRRGRKNRNRMRNQHKQQQPHRNQLPKFTHRSVELATKDDPGFRTIEEPLPDVEIGQIDGKFTVNPAIVEGLARFAESLGVNIKRK